MLTEVRRDVNIRASPSQSPLKKPILSSNRRQTTSIPPKKHLNHLENAFFPGHPDLGTPYTQLILQYTLKKDTFFNNMIDPNYMLTKQNDITEKMRAILIDWLVEIHMKFALNMETLYLTIILLDRYLSKETNVPRSKLQLIGVTCLYVASKIEESFPADIAELSYMTENSATVPDIIKTESALLNLLDFQLIAPTPVLFINQAALLCNWTKEMRCMAFYLAELTLPNLALARHPASVVAAAAVYLTHRVFKVSPAWPGALVDLFEKGLEASVKEIHQKVAELVPNHEKRTIVMNLRQKNSNHPNNNSSNNNINNNENKESCKKNMHDDPNNENNHNNNNNNIKKNNENNDSCKKITHENNNNNNNNNSEKNNDNSDSCKKIMHDDNNNINNSRVAQADRVVVGPLSVTSYTCSTRASLLDRTSDNNFHRLTTFRPGSSASVHCLNPASVAFPNMRQVAREIIAIIEITETCTDYATIREKYSSNAYYQVAKMLCSSSNGGNANTKHTAASNNSNSSSNSVSSSSSLPAVLRGLSSREVSVYRTAADVFRSKRLGDGVSYFLPLVSSPKLENMIIPSPKSHLTLPIALLHPSNSTLETACKKLFLTQCDFTVALLERAPVIPSEIAPNRPVATHRSLLEHKLLAGDDEGADGMVSEWMDFRTRLLSLDRRYFLSWVVYVLGCVWHRRPLCEGDEIPPPVVSAIADEDMGALEKLTGIDGGESCSSPAAAARAVVELRSGGRGGSKRSSSLEGEESTDSGSSKRKRVSLESSTTM